MLQSISIENFKSFRQATLPLAPLTLLIGANASGKSNAIEAMQLLSWLATGRRLGDILVAMREQELNVRGTLVDFLFQHRGGRIVLGCSLTTVDYPHPLDFRITLQLSEDDEFRVLEEVLENPAPDSRFPLYRVEEPARSYGNEIQVAYNNFARGGKKPRITCIDQQAVFTQLTTPARFAADHQRSQELIPAATSGLQQNLESILFLDPVPRRMRGYSYKRERSVQGDGAALSSILYQLKVRGQKERILDFIRSLPEQDIRDLDFIHTPRNEVMVQLQENFGIRAEWRDAAVLSDGTLRVLAVAAALLSVPPGSTVVIEEIDNGVHPSRAALLLDNIKRAAEERNLKVLLTTHNPALLDAIPVESIPDTVACYRDPEEGDSRLVRLADLGNYPELVAQGPLGQLVTKGILDRALKAPDREDAEERVEKGLDWLREFERSAR